MVVDGHCGAGVEGVWAVGDCVRGQMLAHKGFEEGMAVAEIIAGKAGHVNLDTIPWVIYTEPEIAWVGKTEAQCKAENIPYKTGSFPFAAFGRAAAQDEAARFVKIIAHAQPEPILCAHPAGANVAALALRAFNREIQRELGIPNSMTTVANASIRSAEEVFHHPGGALLCVTGGQAVVRAAVKSGTRGIAGGPGKPADGVGGARARGRSTSPQRQE